MEGKRCKKSITFSVEVQEDDKNNNSALSIFSSPIFEKSTKNLAVGENQIFLVISDVNIKKENRYGCSQDCDCLSLPPVLYKKHKESYYDFIHDLKKEIIICSDYFKSEKYYRSTSQPEKSLPNCQPTKSPLLKECFVKLTRLKDEDYRCAEKDLLKCKTCNKIFKQRNHLESHFRTHSKGKPFEYTLCDETFSAKYKCSNHKKLPQSCGRTFRTVQKNHDKTCSSSHQCKICGKIFSLSDTLSLHMQLHTGVTLFKCDQCNKEFTSSQHLKVHKKVHTNFKTYNCECGKSFYTFRKYKIHEKLHKKPKGGKRNIILKMNDREKQSAKAKKKSLKMC